MGDNRSPADLVIMATIARRFPHAAMHNGLGMLTPPGVPLMLMHQGLQPL